MLDHLHIIRQFNNCAEDLPALQDFIQAVQSGDIAILTDGQGSYWTSISQYSPDTGREQPPIIVALNIGQIQSASAGMSELGALIGSSKTSSKPSTFS